MTHKVEVKLNEAQWDRLKIHAKEKGRSEPEDMVAVWWGRVQALDRYAEKQATKDAEFRAYAPKLLPDDERSKIKALAVKEGIAPPPPKKREPKPKKERSSKGRKAALQAVNTGSSPVRSTKKKGKKIKPGKLVYRIDLYDAEGPALSKARHIAEESGKTVAAVLKEHGRDAHGKLVKS